MIDLGGIDTAAAVEMTMALWMRVTVARGNDAPPVQLGHQRLAVLGRQVGDSRLIGGCPPRALWRR